MKNLVIIGHPDKNSFCHNGIYKTITQEIKNSDQELEVIDLYGDSFTRPRNNLIENYKKLVLWCERIYIICLLYTSPSPRDRSLSRMPSSA